MDSLKAVVDCSAEFPLIISKFSLALEVDTAGEVTSIVVLFIDVDVTFVGVAVVLVIVVVVVVGVVGGVGVVMDVIVVVIVVVVAVVVVVLASVDVVDEVVDGAPVVVE